MNNGRPNYQQPMSGQQPGRGMPQQGGYPPQPGYYPPQQQRQGYYPPQQGGYPPQGQPPQMPQGYAPQPGYGPQGMPGQGYPPYPQGQAPQGQPPYQQPYGQQPYGQPGYPPQQGYGMQGYPGPGGYPPYGGGTPQKPPRKPFPWALAIKIALYGVLPLLFLLGLILDNTILKWIFIVLSVAGVSFLWVKPLMPANTRLTLTAVYAAAAIVALVSSLMGAPVDRQQQDPGAAPPAAATADPFAGLDGMMTGTENGNMLLTEVTPTPAPALEDEAAYSQLMSFFYFWKNNMLDEMITLCAPSWQSSVEEPRTALFQIKANRTPVSYAVEKINGRDSDMTRTATVTAEMDRNNGREPSKYRMSIIMLKENDIWYVDPKSLTSAEPTDVPTATPTATPKPTEPVTSSTVLYYNEKGGQYYHADPNCARVHKKYLPLTGTFTFAQINDKPYSELVACNMCNAPLREN